MIAAYVIIAASVVALAYMLAFAVCAMASDEPREDDWT